MEYFEGDIVLAPFIFAEGDQAKLRPCLLWELTPLTAKLVYITSKKLDKAFAFDVVLNGDQAAAIGLQRPSRIDFSKRCQCLRIDLGKRLGKLHDLPRGKIKECAAAAHAVSLV